MKRLIHWMACGLGAGYVPGIPGTAGTVVAVGFAAVLHPLSHGQFVIVTLVFCCVAIWIADLAFPAFATKDPKCIVIDEIAGYLVTLVGHPISWPVAIMAFVAFRFFDITKPPPCRKVEHWRGGLGICADDILAGVYANLFVWGLRRWVF